MKPIEYCCMYCREVVTVEVIRIQDMEMIYNGAHGHFGHASVPLEQVLPALIRQHEKQMRLFKDYSVGPRTFRRKLSDL